MEKYHAAPFLILASQSPRRKDLLSRMGMKFTIIPSAVDENAITGDAPKQYVMKVAHAKAIEISDRYPSSWVLAADTIVCIEDKIFGKPKNAENAYEMLQMLSDRTHKVMTAFVLTCHEKGITHSDRLSTDVTFKPLTNSEIKWYINTGEPFDKAGAYAIQGIGSFLVKAINGSYTNVVGLPICEVFDLLQQEGLVNGLHATH